MQNVEHRIQHLAFSIKKTAASYAAVFLNKLLLSVNGALTAILALALELDGTVNQSEQGVILADTNVDTGMDVEIGRAHV